LPEDWIMTPEQAAKMMALDQETRAGYAASIKTLDPRSDPNMSSVIWLLDMGKP
jgi:hypothetical protein